MQLTLIASITRLFSLHRPSNAWDQPHFVQKDSQSWYHAIALLDAAPVTYILSPEFYMFRDDARAQMYHTCFICIVISLQIGKETQTTDALINGRTEVM